MRREYEIDTHVERIVLHCLIVGRTITFPTQQNIIRYAKTAKKKSNVGFRKYVTIVNIISQF